MSNFLDQLPPNAFFSRIRRNHGLEHATIHILSHKFPARSMAGYSDPGGFWLLGDLEADDVRAAAEQALARMQRGEHTLAIHPNCGTNFATSGMMAGMAGAVAMFGVGDKWSDRLDRLPLAGLLATFALILSRPLGFMIQASITTSGRPGTLEITSVTPSMRGKMRVHRVATRG